MIKSAVLSDCETYRYLLTRAWRPELPILGFVMLNPSIADAQTDDPTIRKCVGFAQRLRHPVFAPDGFGSIAVANLFAYRATDPQDLWRAAKLGNDIVGGPRNELPFATPRGRPGFIVAAWGGHARAAARGRQVRTGLRLRGVDLYRLGALTRAGQPRHPLYLPYETPMSYWSEDL